jgi:TatD DNase family protein
MNTPEPGDYIDIHNHGAKPCAGQFQVECLMTHEKRVPGNEPGLTYTIGIHPWFLTVENFDQQLNIVRENADHQNIIAIGEAGFDRLKGTDGVIQNKAFEEQVRIAERAGKPVIIHCVKAWDELLGEHKKLRPSTKWLVHGFRGKKELAMQLISRGIYLSFWFDFVIRPESTTLMQSLPKDMIFLETDGSDTNIEKIYEKVASDLSLAADDLKRIIFSNFKTVFIK